MTVVGFRQGDVGLAVIDRGVLEVPVQHEPRRLPLHAGGFLSRWLPGRTVYARVRLDRLTAINHDCNDRARWFDLHDVSGGTLRLLAPLGQLRDEEAAVLTALRDLVEQYGLDADLDTRRALGVSDDRT